MPDYTIKSEVFKKPGRRCDLILTSYGSEYKVFTLSGLESGVMRRKDICKEPSLSGARNIFQQTFETKIKEGWKHVPDATVNVVLVSRSESGRNKVTKPATKPSKPKQEKVDRNITFDL